MKKLLITMIFITAFVVAIASPTISKDYSIYATDILVSLQNAKKMIEIEENLVILDVRKQAVFEKSHVEGSYQIWRYDFLVDKGEYKNGSIIINPKKMAEILGSYGIEAETHILLLSENVDYEATRLWWILDMYGHKNMSMIDGGIDRWKKVGLKLVSGAVLKPSVETIYEFTNPLDKSKLASLEDVKTATKSDTVILDTRTYLEYDGLIQSVGSFTKGRIPSSDHISLEVMVNEDKTFKIPEEMELILAKQGITEDMAFILYCHSAAKSAYLTFILSELLGYKNVKNYDGSWNHWSYESIQGNVDVEKDNIFKTLFSYIKNREKLESIITMLGVWGPLGYIIIYALVTITMISALPLTIAGGIIFGPIMGIVYTAIGAGLGLSLSFLIARYIARGAIEKRFGNTPTFKKIDEGVRKDGWFILATTRLIPIFPFGIQNYIYGLTSIGFVQYSLLSVIFILPGTSVFVMLAGAFASGDKAIVLKYSITASLIFMGLMVITKIIKKKSTIEKKKTK